MSVSAAVFVGGGVGSVLRHFLSSQIGSHWGIMLVNVLGAMLIGMACVFCRPGRLASGNQGFCRYRVVGRFYDIFDLHA